MPLLCPAPAGPPSRSSLLPLSIEQPRAAGAPPEAASSLSQSSSPAQRELPQKQPPPSLNRAAPRSGSSPRSSLLPLSIEQPRAAGAPPEAASSLRLWSSPAQRELPQKQPPPSLYGAAPRSGSSPKSSLFSPSIDLSSSPAQRELPQMKPPSPSLNGAAAPRSGSSPRSSLFSPSIEQPRAAGAPPEAASSLPLWSSPAQRELPQMLPLLSLYRAAPRIHKASRNSLLPLSIEQPRAAGGGSSLPKLLPSSSSGPPSLSHLHLEVLEHSVGVRSTDANSRVRLSKDEGTAFHMHHSSSFRL